MSLISTTHSGRSLLGSLCLLLCWHGGFWQALPPGHAADLPVEIELSTVPAPEHIRPDDDVVRVTLRAWHQRKPLTAGHLTLQVTAPPRSTVLTTDFPHVEGTPLLALASDLAPDGTFTFQYVFPIRGVYTFALQIAPVPGEATFRPTSLTQTMSVSEAPEEVRNAWLFVLGLLVLGFLAGRILARSAAAREALQTGAMVVICLLTGGLLVGHPAAALAQEHAPAAHPSPGTQVTQGPDGWELAVQPQPPSATVGQLLNLAIALSKDGQVWPHRLEVMLTAASQEDGKEIFQTTLRTQTGQLAPQLQFFDGAPHSVTITTHPVVGTESEVAPLTLTMGLDVLALHPPMTVKLRIMALLILVLVLGLAAGFFSSGRLKESGSA